MAGPISMKVRIEYAKVGDIVADKGEVVEVIDRRHASFIRLVVKGGVVVEGNYGKKVSILRPDKNLSGMNAFMPGFNEYLEKEKALKRG